MKIIRADINDTAIFDNDELRFGGCCFFTEDRLCKYFFRINGREATLFKSSDKYIPQVIDEFLFYSGFIATIHDEKGIILLERKPSEAYLCEIDKLQPSQFYINKTKLENCKRWIKSQDDIFAPIVISEGRTILQDGHTRVRAAIELGYTCINVYPEEHTSYILDFVDEAVKRQINSISDMQLLDDDEYRVKWHGFCDAFFEGRE